MTYGARQKQLKGEPSSGPGVTDHMNKNTF